MTGMKQSSGRQGEALASGQGSDGAPVASPEPRTILATPEHPEHKRRMNPGLRTAVFLGAGASKAFGYPLTSEILPRILVRLREKTLFGGSTVTPAKAKENRKLLRHCIARFLPGLTDQIDDPAGLGVGITDLLTLVDRALLHGEARAGIPPETVSRFRELLERGIYEALMRNNDRRKGPSATALSRFGRWLEKQPGPVSVVTTNYDMAVDSKIIAATGRKNVNRWDQRVGDKVDFGCSWRTTDEGVLVPRPPQPAWSLLKLHGSVNWLRCPLCGQITMSLRSARGAKAFSEAADEWNTCRCDQTTRMRLHLVTPSLIRSYQDPQLLGIWQAAIESLRTAQRWVIVGYSLPAEDVAIRSLLLRAWDSHAHPADRSVTVVQRQNAQTELTYRAFFPRERLDYQKDGLTGFLDREKV